MYPFFKVICQGFFKLISDLKISGQDHIPQKGPFVLVANHQSLLDPLVLIACIPRKITFLAASYIFKIPLVGHIVRAGGALPVNSNQGSIKSAKHCLSRLFKGEVIGLFPEGGVSLDGRLKPFMPGWAYLALKTGVPALPVALTGTGKVLPVGTYIPRRGRISVNIGEPVPVEKKLKIRRQDLEELNQKITRTISSLMKAITY